jgi:hypothetical protein
VINPNVTDFPFVVIDDENDISGIQSRDAAKLVFLRNCLLFWV